MLNPGPNRSLALQAYDGWDIPNEICLDQSAGLVRLNRDALGLMLPAARHLGPPTGRYNCHGLVFASRRTAIPPVELSVDIDEVLIRDCYEPVAEPQVGDVVIYRKPDNEITHSGQVCRIDHLGERRAVCVRSAWGYVGEFEHQERACPYTKEQEQIEYWRLRC